MSHVPRKPTLKTQLDLFAPRPEVPRWNHLSRSTRQTVKRQLTVLILQHANRAQSGPRIGLLVFVDRSVIATHKFIDSFFNPYVPLGSQGNRMKMVYVFETLFCLPARGNEKPVVENRVKTLERKWSTPVPRVKDLAELNAYLRTCCEQDQLRCSSGRSETIDSRLQQEQAEAASLPKHRFDPSIRRTAQVNKYQFVRFDKVNYSVPRDCAFQNVTVKGYVDRVEIIFRETVVAKHPRSYEAGDQVLDPLHYLNTLERRPAALDHANVYRNWTLPAAFEELRQRLETRHGARAGVRQYVRVLQLLAQHPQKRVQQAIEQLRGLEGADADQIINRVERSAAHAQQDPSQAAVSHDDLMPEVLAVQVPPPWAD